MMQRRQDLRVRGQPVFKGRRKVKELTGSYQGPTLVLDDGSLVDGTDNIVVWTKANSIQRRPVT